MECQTNKNLAAYRSIVFFVFTTKGWRSRIGRHSNPWKKRRFSARTPVPLVPICNGETEYCTVSACRDSTDFPGLVQYSDCMQRWIYLISGHVSEKVVCADMCSGHNWLTANSKKKYVHRGVKQLKSFIQNHFWGSYFTGLILRLPINSPHVEPRTHDESHSWRISLHFKISVLINLKHPLNEQARILCSTLHCKFLLKRISF